MDATKTLVTDVLGFIKSLIDAIKIIMDSVVKTPNWTKPEYQPTPDIMG